MTARSFLSSLAMAVAAAGLCVPQGVMAQAKPSNAQKQQNKMMGEIPKCSKKLGTISVVDGDDSRAWQQMNLSPPQKLIKVMVQKSGCFSLVDRGAGLNAAQRERDLNGSLGLQGGSNVGKNQIKAADFVLVAEIASADANTGGGAAAGILGGVIGGRAGAIVGGIRSKKLEANVVLSLTDVRTSESNAFEGSAAKNDIGWAAGGGIGFAGAVGGGYEDTEIGKIVTQAFIVAYTNMVQELGGIEIGGKEAAPSRSFTVITATTMRKTPDAKGAVVRALPVGMVVYPTGKKEGMWWEVMDDNENTGWVLNDKLQASQ